MVEPKVDEHFLELPLTVDRAEQLLLPELSHYQPCSSHRLGNLPSLRALLVRARRVRSRLSCARPWRLRRVVSIWLGLDAQLPLTPPLHLGGKPVLLNDLPSTELEGLESGEPSGHLAVVDLLGVQLFLDVVFETPSL